MFKRWALFCFVLFCLFSLIRHSFQLFCFILFCLFSLIRHSFHSLVRRLCVVHFCVKSVLSFISGYPFMILGSQMATLKIFQLELLFDVIWR